MYEFCKGGGCTAKLGPGILDKVLKMIPKKADPNLLVGFDHSDDAAVYQLTEDLAVVQTLDFFPPMVEDPYLFRKDSGDECSQRYICDGRRGEDSVKYCLFPRASGCKYFGTDPAWWE